MFDYAGVLAGVALVLIAGYIGVIVGRATAPPTHCDRQHLDAEDGLDWVRNAFRNDAGWR